VPHPWRHSRPGWLATLHIAGGLKLDDHCGPFQLRPFYDSMIVHLQKYINTNIKQKRTWNLSKAVTDSTTEASYVTGKAQAGRWISHWKQLQ